MTYISQHCKSQRKLSCSCNDERMAKGSNSTPGPITLAIADIIYARMAELRTNKTKLAVASGIPRTTLGNIVLGNKVYDIENLDKVCQALEIAIEDVLRDAAARTDSRVVDSGIQPVVRPSR